MNAYDEFFKENVVKLHFNRTAVKCNTIMEARNKFLEYINSKNITSDGQLFPKDGLLTVKGEIIAVFSIDGLLYNTDEDMIDVEAQ